MSLAFLWGQQAHEKVLKRGEVEYEMILKDHCGCCVKKKKKTGGWVDKGKSRQVVERLS